MKTTLLAASVLATSLTLAGPATAEQPQRSAQPAQPPAAAQTPLPKAEDFSEQQLEAFVDSQKEMGSIQREYAKKLQNKQDKPQEAMAIRKEAQQALASAVQESGLEVQTYNQIIRLAQNDQAFRAQLEAMM
ncbi:MAG: DUF4168 domain-containing protein [Pseudomonadota bacterium]|jgi:hypothetical protein|uniref:DUF4168 domain-containing protein n=1 Tax=Alcanivorax sp. TaxID=1872427 RepID=UPI00243C9735|nr:DUF4168 domain-containing protein [Alcanivorax sp.]MEE3321397.1 DUF4168 domain-containing protein [Pseudomonadota bacterium]